MMFYVFDKEDNIIMLEDYNIYCMCPICNDDVPVNLSELLKEHDAYLDNVEVFCRKCSVELGY